MAGEEGSAKEDGSDDAKASKDSNKDDADAA